MRPPRLRPQSSAFDCTRIRFDDGICEPDLPIDARKHPGSRAGTCRNASPWGFSARWRNAGQRSVESESRIPTRYSNLAMARQPARWRACSVRSPRPCSTSFRASGRPVRSTSPARGRRGRRQSRVLRHRRGRPPPRCGVTDLAPRARGRAQRARGGARRGMVGRRAQRTVPRRQRLVRPRSRTSRSRSAVMLWWRKSVDMRRIDFGGHWPRERANAEAQ